MHLQLFTFYSFYGLKIRKRKSNRGQKRKFHSHFFKIVDKKSQHFTKQAKNSSKTHKNETNYNKFVDKYAYFYANLTKSTLKIFVDNPSKMVENVKKERNINKKMPIFPQTYVCWGKLSTFFYDEEYSFCNFDKKSRVKHR